MSVVRLRSADRRADRFERKTPPAQESHLFRLLERVGRRGAEPAAPGLAGAAHLRRTRIAGRARDRVGAKAPRTELAFDARDAELAR